MTDQLGACTSVLSLYIASTLVGLVRLRPQNAVFIRWQAMSPSAPVPKSHHPRHLNGR